MDSMSFNDAISSAAVT